MLNIALAQMEVVCGRPQENFETMVDFIEKAKKDGADVIIFSELCVSGYFLADRFFDDDFCRYTASFNQKLKELSSGIGIVWGNIHYDAIDATPKGRDGRPLRTNCAFFAYNKEWVNHEGTKKYPGMYIKHLNPDYRVFEDSRYMMSALELVHDATFSLEESHRPFLFKNKRIGLEICEDMWSDDYGVDITTYYAEKNVEILINLSASPWTKNKEKARYRHIMRHVLEHDIPYFIYVNQVGMGNNGKNVMVFDGGSAVFDASGQRFACNDRFQSELLLCTIDLVPFQSNVQQKNQTWNQSNQTTPTTKLLNALLYGIQCFDKELFGAKLPWIIGLSGGLDSSVSAALLSMALGSERLIAYNMKTTYNTSKTIDNATTLANALGITLKHGVMASLVDTTKQVVITEYGYSETSLHGLVEENIQARLRGHLLSTFASIHGGVICNNGNKLEAALGYATLYGDSIGALCVLGDVLKTELFDLSHEINHVLQKEVIPMRLLPIVSEKEFSWEMPPSAELKEDQFDPMKWFYHDALIEYLTSFPLYGVESLLRKYLDGSLLVDPTFGRWITHYGLDDPSAFIEDLEWVVQSMNRAVFKRIQMPPILTISKGAFGSDIKENQMNVEKSEMYQALKASILHKKQGS